MVLSRVQLGKMFLHIGERLKDKGTIVLCGGANIIIVSDDRESTMDVDYLYADEEVLAAFKEYATENELSINIMNDDVKVTSSYSSVLLEYKALYKIYGNLSVYALQPIALLCMKLKSFRPDSSDYVDCQTLITICKNVGYTLQDIFSSLRHIYIKDATISVEAETFLRDQFDQGMFYLDPERVDSYINMLVDGIIQESDLPDEYKEQILSAYQKHKVDRIAKAFI